jgi:putative hemin transport protein
MRNSVISAVDSQRPLAERWSALREESPRLRNRDAACALGISEAELVAAGLGAPAIRLQGPFGAMLAEFESLGDVMILTRNESAVHEKYGRFANVSANGHIGLVLNHDIDLRLFFKHWRFGFAVSDETAEGPRRSLQFFDEGGDAVHKVFLRPSGDADAYTRLVERHRASEQEGGLTVVPHFARPKSKPDSAIDVESFRKAWQSLQDTHDFYGLLVNFGLEREQGLRLAGSDLAYRVAPKALRQLLEGAAVDAVPIMVFVGNRGAIQIHTGPVKRLKAMGPWFNVLDDGFNLHLREDHIDSAWVVRKPTRDGIVTSLELYDRDSELIASFFGSRKPGVAELESWRALVATLEPAGDRR